LPRLSLISRLGQEHSANTGWLATGIA
jgi:hypothetical protein